MYWLIAKPGGSVIQTFDEFRLQMFALAGPVSQLKELCTFCQRRLAEQCNHRAMRAGLADLEASGAARLIWGTHVESRSEQNNADPKPSDACQRRWKDSSAFATSTAGSAAFQALPRFVPAYPRWNIAG